MLSTLRETVLNAWQREHGARFAEFAGWSLPVQFKGTLAEHAAARSGAALFDVSHMGQVRLPLAQIEALERLVPSDLTGLPAGRQRYTVLLNEAGGIRDDVIVSRFPDFALVVVNAARVESDIALMGENGLTPDLLEDRVLLALQGPLAATVLEPIVPGVDHLRFLDTREFGPGWWVSRSGYTGEDGFELSVPAKDGVALAERLVEGGAVPAGLAARDTLRLEAGLPLYGADLDELTTPIEAGLAWVVAKRRAVAGAFPGAAVIAGQMAQGVARKRVGLRIAGRAIARAGAEIVREGEAVGHLTSGSFSPALSAPIAMGYIAAHHTAPGTGLALRVRGVDHPASVVPLPFVPHRYRR